MEEAEQTTDIVDAKGEGEPFAAAAETGPGRRDGGELEGVAHGGAELARRDGFELEGAACED